MGAARACEPRGRVAADRALDVDGVAVASVAIAYDRQRVGRLVDASADLHKAQRASAAGSARKPCMLEDV
jgi:hypothetical protein